ncbi:hypothetical protein F8154_14145 [Alkaliphilus pronyensis]|uniref:Uncharacterized protein n=1 Tax=Alkaliphilus pronyensis TaxID=1482732 RepID=A0A6I0F7B8_9FIRM|nr:hypothetical protein [Alkaliphilus pronyensis]KAB3530208.1 hypothetical protein F8154_14145 [Alkaliphilus pronyensis]
MIKRLLYCTAFVLLIIGFTSISAFGNETDEKLQVITPDRNITTDNTELMFEITAPEGTKVFIQVYHNNSIDKSKENYVVAGDAIELEIGAFGRGWQEVPLRRGKNKVEIKGVYSDDSHDTITRIITVQELKEVKEIFEKKVSEPDILQNIIK